MELLLSRPEEPTSKETEMTSAAAAAAFPAFIWTGITHQRLESLEAGASIQLSLEFVPVMIGLQVNSINWVLWLTKRGFSEYKKWRFVLFVIWSVNVKFQVSSLEFDLKVGPLECQYLVFWCEKVQPSDQSFITIINDPKFGRAISTDCSLWRKPIP